MTNRLRLAAGLVILIIRPQTGLKVPEASEMKAYMQSSAFPRRTTQASHTSNWIVSIVLILVATDTYRAVALAASVSLPVITAVLLAVLAMFFLSGGRQALRLLKKPCVALLLCLLTLWPIAALSYSVAPPIKLIMERLSFSIVFLSSTLFFVKYGLVGARKIFSISAVVASLGAALSWLAPGLFLGMASQAGTSILYEGRAFGFFLQPNVLGMGMCFIMLAWIASEMDRSSWLIAVWLLIFGATVLLSGSRFATLAMFLMLFLVYVGSGSSSRMVNAHHIIRVMQFGAILAALWFIVYAIVFFAIDIDNLVEKGNIYDRLNSLIHFKIFHSGDSDGQAGSWALRKAAWEEYWAMLVERPWLGHGYGTQSTLFWDLRITTAAHNSALALAVDLGIPFVLLFWLVVGRCVVRKEANSSWERVGFNAGAIFFALFTSVLFLNHGMLENRFFYVSFAFVVALACYPSAFATRLNSTERHALQTGIEA